MNNTNPFGSPPSPFSALPAAPSGNAGGGVPFSAAPSSGSASSMLTPAVTAGSTLPDLLLFIRNWHRGKKMQTSGGEMVVVPWFALEAIHLDAATQIYVHSIDPTHTDDQTALAVETRILHRARAYADAGPQRFEIRCHFRNEAGDLTGWEPWTGLVTLPPQNPQWGTPHQGGMGMGGGFGGGPMGGPAHVLQVLVRGTIDAAQRSDLMAMRAFDAQNHIITTMSTQIDRYQSHEVERERMFQEMRINARKEKLEEQMAEIKMAALTTAIEKTMQALPLFGVGFNRWLALKSAEKHGTGSSKERKALAVLRKVYDGLKDGPSKDNPDMAKQALVMAGVRPEDVDEAFAMFQEFAIDDMVDGTDKSIKARILGIVPAEEDAAPTGFQRLLRVVGLKSANDEGKTQTPKAAGG